MLPNRAIFHSLWQTRILAISVDNLGTPCDPDGPEASEERISN